MLSDVATGTEKSFTESTDSTSTPSLTDQHSTAAPQTTDVSADATDGPSTSRGIVTTEENATSYMNDTRSTVTSAPSNHQGTRTTLNAFTDQSPAGDASTRHGGTESISTRGATDNTSLQTMPEIKNSTSLKEFSTLGNITDHPGNTHAPTVMSTGGIKSNDNEGNFTSNGEKKQGNAVLVSSESLFVLF